MEHIPADILDKVKAFMATGIPFNRFVGIQIAALESGRAVLEIPFRDDLIGDPFRPAIHGGVIATLVDTAGGAALFTCVEVGDRLSTVDLRIDYLRPAGRADLRAEAEVIRLGNRVGVVRVLVFSGASRDPVAQGVGVFNVRRS